MGCQPQSCRLREQLRAGQVPQEPQALLNVHSNPAQLVSTGDQRDSHGQIESAGRIKQPSKEILQGVNREWPGERRML